MVIAVNGGIEAVCHKNLNQHGKPHVQDQFTVDWSGQVPDVKRQQDNRTRHRQRTCNGVKD